MRIHFIAIGGSAMHNLGIAMHCKGFQVSGSDDEIFEPAASRLKSYGLLPPQLGWFPEKIDAALDAVILGMHARADNPELIKAQQLDIKIYSFPEYLYQHSARKKRVVIAGSHGKTTITAMVLHALKYNGLEPDFMVGAEIPGFDLMVRLTDDANTMVLEGDEYLSSAIDRVPKFWHYWPHIAVLSGIGWDHVNVFPTFENYLAQFKEFLRRLPPEGVLIYNALDSEVCKLAEEAICRKQAYGLPKWRKGTDGPEVMDESGKFWPIRLFGQHNLLNLMAARGVCNLMGLDDSGFFEAITSFKGAARRLECVHHSPGLTIYRDFAHAPSKLKASIEALRTQHPHEQLVICFELHTYSSLSSHFMPNYRYCLELADAAAIFYDPHAVALKRLELVSPQYIREAFALPNAEVLSDANQLMAWLKTQCIGNCVVGLMSSGSFKGMNLNELIVSLEK